jgi:tetratricopeptide (TPR) repeat protein
LAQPAAFKYRAFLSYSHHDKSWAEWLHGALEGYRVDKDLINRQTAAGPVPNILRPIFRDRDDFSAGHSLDEQTLAALEASQFLIVVCSPNAAASTYVNEEIRRFKMMGRADRVIAIIVDGEPGDPARECFPKALRFKVGPDGQLTDEREEPIAADARPQGDGKRPALQKVVAALIGVSFDDVRKREAIGDNRRIKIGAAAIGVLAALVLFAGYLFVEHSHQQNVETERIAEQQKRDSEHAKQLGDMQATLKALTEKLIGASPAQAAPGQAVAVAEAVNAAAKGAQEGDDRFKQALELLKENKVTDATALFQAVADDKAARIKQDSKEAAAAYRNLGAIAGLADPKRALDAYTKAVDLDPDDLRSLLWVGWIQKERGYLEDSEKRLQRLLSIAKINDDFWRYWAHLGLGDIRRDRADPQGAMTHYLEAQSLSERLSNASPNNIGWERDLSVFYDKIGDMLQEQHKLPEALKYFQDSLAVVERLAKADPNHTEWQRDLSVLYTKVGDVLNAQGNSSEALKSFRDSLTIAERLAKEEPNNARSQRDLSVSYERVGDTLKTQGNLIEALEYYREDLTIAERLVEADPTNVQWQVDLLWSHWRLATNGDESERRWTLIVTTLRQLKQDGKLTVEQAGWLPEAEEQLAKIKP